MNAPLVRSSLSLSTSSPIWQWSLLVLGSLIASVCLHWAKLPAALLLGPMIAGILIGTRGGTIRVGRLPYEAAQALIGCLIARAITPDMLRAFAARWPLFVGVVAIIVLASSLLGWAVSKLQVLPGTTAIWGLLPGAASAMMVMAESFGADARLVAFMQYLRVVFVALAASSVARFWVHVAPGAQQPIDWFPALEFGSFFGTVLVALLGTMLSRLLRLGAGALILPALLATTAQLSDLLDVQLPPWLLAGSYAALGWTIGLRFTTDVLGHALRVLPQTLLSIAALMAFCGGLAFALTRMVGVDPLTAYLATCPGGLDSVAIIAATTKVDLPFVVSLQTVRFSVVLALGPSLSRFVARRLSH